LSKKLEEQEDLIRQQDSLIKSKVSQHGDSFISRTPSIYDNYSR
jgi:hypothetical protein